MNSQSLDDRQKQSLRQFGFREPLGEKKFSHGESIAQLATLLPISGLKIIEPACNEGYATAALAVAGGAVTAFDIRPAPIVRAFARCLYHDVAERVKLLVGDAESLLANVAVDEFDLLFHAGLLYHLPDPVRHLKAVARLCRWVFLDTHVAHEQGEPRPNDFLDEEIATCEDGYRGRWYRESGWLDDLSGVGEQSFWLLEGELWRLIGDAGLRTVKVIDDSGNSSGRRFGILLTRQ